MDNGVTTFVRRAIALVRDKHATPADMLVEVSREGPEVRALFVGVAGQWSNIDRYHDWPCATTSNSVHEAIKRQGKGDAVPWGHEGMWAESCTAAERSRGQTSRHEGEPQPAAPEEQRDAVLDLLAEAGWGADPRGS